MSKRILYFIPDNPCVGKTGSRTRYIQLLDYLISLSPEYLVDVISIGDWGHWDKDNKETFETQYPHIKLHIFNRRGSDTSKLKKYLEYKIPNAIPKLFKGTTVDITNFILRNKIKRLVNREGYDIVIASYTSWGRVFDGIDKSILKIIDTHDFWTAQRKDDKQLGKLFESEINILRKFDMIWTFSTEEAYIFEQFTNAEVIQIPVANRISSSTRNPTKDYDVLYVASDNPHNMKSARWLCEHVLPHLENVKIHFVGEICKHIKDHKNIVNHGIVEDLDNLYHRSKIAICPMLSGTGIKIKVIEALSYSLPVVTTKRGLDGLIDKSRNGCVLANDAYDFAKSILQLMSDTDFYNEKVREAKEYYTTNHSLALENKILDSIFPKN